MRIHNPLELKVGDVFYESAYGKNLQMKVTESPIFENNQWKWKAADSKGTETDYLITKGLEHYGPKIYWQPAYMEIK
jgi:hypothetical protein